MKKLALAAFLTVAAAGAFADHPHGLPPGIAKKQHVHLCDHCGRVENVRLEKQKGEGGAVGILAGAAAGGLLGNQVGKGNGKALATVGGAVAGGFVGNEVQKRVSTKETWVTEVRMRDGSLRHYEQGARPAWKAGSVVKVHARGLALAD